MNDLAHRQVSRLASSGASSLNAIAALGEGSRKLLRQLSLTLNLAATVVIYALEPATWRRTVRRQFLWHLHRTAVGGMPAVAGSGALIGLVMVLQALVWIEFTGEIDIVAELIVLTLIREVAPLFTSFIIVGRSATVMAVMLGRMTVSGQVETLEVMGVDPLRILVVPRVLAAALGCFSLTILFLCVSLAMGYIAAIVSGIGDISPGRFVVEVLQAMGAREFLLLTTKSLIAGFAAGIVACSIGLSPRIAAGDVPRILPRCFVLGSLTVLAISVALTLIL
jgi:phospholipid/cholesterol/gamma-HCH transport system permease protein